MDLRFLCRMPDCIFLHFEQGLQHPGFEDLELNAEDDHYVMTQFIQYKKNPDHFVCWTKEPQGIVSTGLGINIGSLKVANVIFKRARELGRLLTLKVRARLHNTPVTTVWVYICALVT